MKQFGERMPVKITDELIAATTKLEGDAVRRDVNTYLIFPVLVVCNYLDRY